MSIGLGCQWTLSFLDLSDDVLFILFHYLHLNHLARLCRTCRRLNNLINQHGWAIYLSLNNRHCQSLAAARRTWDVRETLKYDYLTDRAWRDCDFNPRPLSSGWQNVGRCTPAFAKSDSRIVYAAGRMLYVFAFTAPRSAAGFAPGLKAEGSIEVQDPRRAGVGRNNITGLAFQPDESLIATFDDGSVVRVMLPSHYPDKNATSPKPLAFERLYSSLDPIVSLSARASLSLTLSTRREATLYNSLTGISSTLSLEFKRSGAWSAYLSASSPRYAALGSHEPNALQIHQLTESGLREDPYLFLEYNSSTIVSDGHESPLQVRDVVSAISDPPPYFGSSGQVLVAGWIGGVVRVYDLRSSTRVSNQSPDVEKKSKTPILAPVLSMYDSTSRGIGTVTSGGGAGCHIAASSLMDSLISFWDVRSPRDVWSVHAPITHDPSPVYTLGMESSRLFGATQRRPFVYDFGSGLTADTYPSIEMNDADGLILRKNGVGYCYNRFHNYNDTDID